MADQSRHVVSGDSDGDHSNVTSPASTYADQNMPCTPSSVGSAGMIFQANETSKKRQLDETSQESFKSGASANNSPSKKTRKSDEIAHEDFVQKIVDARPDLIPTQSDVLCLENEEKISVNALMKYGYVEVRLIIQWSRKVPGFCDINVDDQMALLKSSFMELNVLRLSYRSLPHEHQLKFAQDIVKSTEDCIEMGWGKDLLDYTFHFIEQMKEIKIDVTEFCFLNAIVLTYPDALGIEDGLAAINLQSKILKAFQKYCSHTYPDDRKRYAKMLLWLPGLRTASGIAAERFLNLSLDGSITMNALVLELMS